MIVRFPVPSKEPEPETSPVKPIVLEDASAVAVAALPVVEPELPVTLPVTLPVRFPSNVPATIVSEPTDHLSSDSSHMNDLVALPPLSTEKPVSSEGVPEVKLELRTIMLSASDIVSELTVVVVPETIKLPVTVNASLTVTIPVPFALSVKLVSAVLDSIASTSIEFENEIAFPSEDEILEPAVTCTGPLRPITPVPVGSKSTSPEPEVCTDTFWFTSAEIVIVPELSDTTCCPLTYNEPGPTKTSLHCLLEEPKS